MTITVSLSPEILSLLRGKGLSTAKAAALLHVRPSQSARLLKRAGAVVTGGVWRIGK